MTPMAVFPALAEPITVPVTRLAAATIVDAGLTGADYAVIEPVDDGVRVRPASVDEELAYEQAHGLGHVTYSLDEFLAELDSDSSTRRRHLEPRGSRSSRTPSGMSG
jgi:hypothetical protein